MISQDASAGNCIDSRLNHTILVLGIFPSIFGHEGADIIREIGSGVTSVKPDERVIPLYMPECCECKSCLSGKTNLCAAIRATQGKGVMPDRTTRFTYTS